MQEFSESDFLENMVKKPTCFKNPAERTCIDPIITNKPRMFQNAKHLKQACQIFMNLS